MANVTLGLLMVVSPGESELGAESLSRALKCTPAGCRVFLVNNGALPDPQRWWTALGCPEHTIQVITPPAAPQAYFEIGRTVFSALREIAGSAPDILFKIDPDTLVVSPEFFSDIVTLHSEKNAGFYACHASSSRQNQFQRCVRLLADLIPVGVGRQPGMTRYGRGLRPRFRPAWYWRAGVAALRRARLCSSLQPSGGFYALPGSTIVDLAARGYLHTQGATGLEWNDDTLLPIAVRAAGGRIYDIRSSRFAPGWRWLHGSRYFSNEQAAEPGLRALHPVKLDAQDRALRNRT